MKSATLYLADELERLISLPLDSEEDLERWYIERYAVEETLTRNFPGFGYWHEVDHFFDDADIRLRDLGYREAQNRKVSRYIAHLRNENTNE